MSDLEQSRLILYRTHDGSPTLSLNQGEKMHHSYGAFSETLFIYFKTLKTALTLFEKQKKSTMFKVMSLGLGLGYLEFMTLIYLFKVWGKNRVLECLRMSSFESEIQLWNLLDEYMHNESSEIRKYKAYSLVGVSLRKDSEQKNQYEVSELIEEKKRSQDFLTPKEISSQSDIYNLYDETIYNFCSIFEVPFVESKEFIKEFYALNSWYKGNDFVSYQNMSNNRDAQGSFECIFYDAFSSKTSNQLWDEKFLTSFLSCQKAPCVFGTYAVTGALKRALKKSQFENQNRVGFMGKRESTLAIRRVHS